MSKLPTLNTILKENFPNSPDIQRLAGILNQFMLETVKAFDRQITIVDNIDGEIKSFIAEGVFPTQLSWTRPRKPMVGFLGAIRRVDGTNFTLSSAVGVDWEYSNTGKITIKGLPGLTSSATDKYEIKLVFLIG